MATIVTVHGTGASGPEHGEGWWQKGSLFEEYLRELIESEDGELKYEPMIWDGANSETSRRAASKQLLQKCCALQRRSEDYCVIGHSHGGSVIAAALFLAARQRRELSRLRKWITVGTPFLVANRRRFLFNRVNFWEKSAYVLVLTSCLLFSVGAFILPGTVQFVTAFRLAKLHEYFFAILIFVFPIALVFFGLSFLSSRRCHSGKRRVAARFDQYFGSRWCSLFHEDDEAIRGLHLATKIKFPIFRRLFLVPEISLLVLVLLPIALLIVVNSQQAMLWLFDFIVKHAPGPWPEFFVENGQLKGHGKDVPANAMLLVVLPLFMLEKIGLGWPLQELMTVMPHLPPFFNLLIFLMFFAIIFYIPSLVLVLAIISLGALASVGLSRVMDGLTWRQLRASAFGDDYQAECITGTGNQPMWLTYGMGALPPELSMEISAFSDQQAAQSIARFRSALNVLAFANGGREKSDMLSRYLTWDELIHTSYFQVPRFRKLVAYAIATAEGFQATEQFRQDPDYPVVKRWFEELQPQHKTKLPIDAPTARPFPEEHPLRSPAAAL